MIGLERDQYVGIACAYGAGRVAYEIERGIGQPDVVEDVVDLPRRNHPANGSLHEVGQLRRVLDARAGLRPHVEH